MVTIYIPPALTFSNFEFCPQSVLMGIVWLSQRTVSIFSNSINQFIFVIEMLCVFFEVGTEFLNII
jgi:hypothetical protein